MVLTIELTQQESLRVLDARALGVNIDTMVRGMIAGLPERIERADSFGTDFLITPRTRQTPEELNKFFEEISIFGRGRGYPPSEVFDRENLYKVVL